jgi:hypothetical protein
MHHDFGVEPNQEFKLLDVSFELRGVSLALTKPELQFIDQLSKPLVDHVLPLY